MADIIQIRRDTATNWTSANPILAQGEMGFETDTRKIKVGDGSTSWNSLVYWDLGTQEYGYVLANNAIFTGSIEERVNTTNYTALSGTVTLTPNDGTVQVWSLSGNITTIVNNLVSGEFISLMISDGTSFTINWGTSITWIGGSAPTLATSGFTVIEIWKVGSVTYGVKVGDVA